MESLQQLFSISTWTSFTKTYRVDSAKLAPLPPSNSFSKLHFPETTLHSVRLEGITGNYLVHASLSGKNGAQPW